MAVGEAYLAAAVGEPLELGDAVALEEAVLDQNLGRSPHVHVILSDMLDFLADEVEIDDERRVGRRGLGGEGNLALPPRRLELHPQVRRVLDGLLIARRDFFLCPPLLFGGRRWQNARGIERKLERRRLGGPQVGQGAEVELLGRAQRHREDLEVAARSVLTQRTRGEIGDGDGLVRGNVSHLGVLPVGVAQLVRLVHHLVQARHIRLHGRLLLLQFFLHNN